jgi:hypothetical protein
MTQEVVRALPDGEILQVIGWGQAELAARKDKRKQDAISKIRELTATVGVTVNIEGARGRRPKSPAAAKPAKAVR